MPMPTGFALLDTIIADVRAGAIRPPARGASSSAALAATSKEQPPQQQPQQPREVPAQAQPPKQKQQPKQQQQHQKQPKAEAPAAAAVAAPVEPPTTVDPEVARKVALLLGVGEECLTEAGKRGLTRRAQNKCRQTNAACASALARTRTKASPA